MSKCCVCNGEFHYKDEYYNLDCNGSPALDEEEGGSGDIYGTVCITCYEEKYEECLLKCGIITKDEFIL